MMFSLLYRILMCAAFCILSSTSSNAGVSLTCNKTVKVEAGKSLKLNCTIHLPLDCRGEDYIWEDPNNNIICNSTSYRPVNYTCEWDGETYVSLLIRNVTESQNYTIQIMADCGYPDTSTVEVKLQVQSDRSMAKTKAPNLPQDSSMVTVIASVFIIALVLGILSVLVTTKRGKEILKCVKRGKNPEFVVASQACLANSIV